MHAFKSTLNFSCIVVLLIELTQEDQRQLLIMCGVAFPCYASMASSLQQKHFAYDLQMKQ